MSLDITTVSRQVYWLSHCTLSQWSVYKYIGCVMLLDITTVSAHVYQSCCITGHNKCMCYWTSQVYWLCNAMVWLVVPWYLWPSLNEGSGLSGFNSLISTSPTKHPEDLPPHGILSMNTKVCNWSLLLIFSARGFVGRDVKEASSGKVSYRQLCETIMVATLD